MIQTIIRGSLLLQFFYFLPAASSSRNLTFGVVSFTPLCSSGIPNDVEIISILNTSELSISFKDVCLNSNNVILMGPSLCSFLKKEAISSIILTRTCYPNCEIVSSLASQLGIPTLQLDPMYFSFFLPIERQPFNMYPQNDLVEAVGSLFVELQLEHRGAAVLYDIFLGNDIVVYFLQSGIDVTPKVIPIDADSEMIKRVLLDIRKTSQRNIVMHISTSTVYLKILEMALLLGMLNKEYFWILSNLETLYQDINSYTYSDVSLLTFNFNSQSCIDAENELDCDRKYGLKVPLAKNEEMINMKIREAVLTVASAVLQISNQTTSLHWTSPSNCSDRETFQWSTGLEIQNIMKETSIFGETGPISFSNRQRSSSKFNIFSLQNESFLIIGNWSLKTGIKIEKKNYMTPTVTSDIDESNKQIFSNPLRLVTILNEPFVEYKSDYEKRSGNDRFTGFLIDMIEILAQQMGFSYEYFLVPDGNFGAQNENGEWNGLIKVLLEKDADIAVAPLTITSARSQAVDFTTPYFSSGRNFVMRKEVSSPTGFVFFDPLSMEVWLMIVLSFILVGLLIFLVTLYNPCEGGQLGIIREESDCGRFKIAKKKITNSFWFAYSALVQQSSDDFIPTSYAARVLSGTWWFFVFIIICMYSANLTAFLTVERLESVIESVEDLVSQTKVSYGVLKNGATLGYLKESKIEPYKTLWENINTNPDWNVDTVDQGMQRICHENYAYLGESATNAYYANTYDANDVHSCSITVKSKDPFGEIGYGLAFQTKSALREIFSTQILDLHEKGSLEELSRIWNLEYSKTEESRATAEGNVLRLENLVGIFYLLGSGCALGILVALLECIWYRQKNNEKKAENSSYIARRCSLGDDNIQPETTSYF